MIVTIQNPCGCSYSRVGMITNEILGFHFCQKHARMIQDDSQILADKLSEAIGRGAHSFSISSRQLSK